MSEFYMNKFGNVFGEMMATPIGRANFINLKTPNTKYQPAKYGLSILFEKKDAAVKTGLNVMIKHCKDLIAFAASKGKKTEEFTVGPIRDGDSDKTSKYQGFAGKWFISAKNASQPDMIMMGKKMEVASPDLFLPGVLVRATVSPIIYDDGVSWKVHAVQFVKDDGVRFYGGPDPKSLLAALDEDEPPAEEALEEPVVATKAKSGKAKAIDLL